MIPPDLPLSIRRFQLLKLSVEQAGPFRQPFALEFTDLAGTPANLFLLASPNGLGKTWLLNTLVALIGLLGDPKCQQRLWLRTDHRDWNEHLLFGPGRAQLDVRLEIMINGHWRAFVLSLFTGPGGPTGWCAEDLDKAQADQWCQIVFRPGDREGGPPLVSADEIGALIRQAVGACRDVVPSSLYDRTITAPTVLYFPAHRRIMRPPRDIPRAICQPPGFCYAPVHIFSEDGQDWENSLDCLLVWYTWLADGRYEDIQELLNAFLFDGRNKTLGPVRREALYAEVGAGGSLWHRLDQLSHGERALMQFAVRLAAHMTDNTTVVIDEMDLHLHPQWRFRLVKTMKTLAKQYSGLTFVFTTHTPEVIEYYSHETVEEGLVKSGHLIDEEEL